MANIKIINKFIFLLKYMLIIIYALFIQRMQYIIY